MQFSVGDYSPPLEIASASGVSCACSSMACEIMPSHRGKTRRFPSIDRAFAQPRARRETDPHPVLPERHYEYRKIERIEPDGLNECVLIAPRPDALTLRVENGIECCHNLLS